MTQQSWQTRGWCCRLTWQGSQHLLQVAIDCPVGQYRQLIGLMVPSLPHGHSVLQSMGGCGAPVVTLSVRHHNNQTGRWLTNFRARWDPSSEKYFTVGSMAPIRQVSLTFTFTHYKFWACQRQAWLHPISESTRSHLQVYLCSSSTVNEEVGFINNMGVCYVVYDTCTLHTSPRLASIKCERLRVQREWHWLL